MERRTVEIGTSLVCRTVRGEPMSIYARATREAAALRAIADEMDAVVHADPQEDDPIRTWLTRLRAIAVTLDGQE